MFLLPLLLAMAFIAPKPVMPHRPHDGPGIITEEVTHVDDGPGIVADELKTLVLKKGRTP
jgi:hypothetical protein